MAFVTAQAGKVCRGVATLPHLPPTALQDWAQGEGLPVPAYATVETTGAAHSPQFTIEVTVRGYAPESAKAPSKRVAEQQAAAKLLERLKS